MEKAYEVKFIETEHMKHWAFKVHGFWPHDTVSITQHLSSVPFEWIPAKINWGSMGRDRGQEPSDAQAARSLASALLKAAQILDECKYNEKTNPNNN